MKDKVINFKEIKNKVKEENNRNLDSQLKDGYLQGVNDALNNAYGVIDLMNIDKHYNACLETIENIKFEFSSEINK